MTSRWSGALLLRFLRLLFVTSEAIGTALVLLWGSVRLYRTKAIQRATGGEIKARVWRGRVWSWGTYSTGVMPMRLGDEVLDFAATKASSKGPTGILPSCQNVFARGLNNDPLDIDFYRGSHRSEDLISWFQWQS